MAAYAGPAIVNSSSGRLLSGRRFVCRKTSGPTAVFGPQPPSDGPERLSSCCPNMGLMTGRPLSLVRCHETPSETGIGHWPALRAWPCVWERPHPLRPRQVALRIAKDPRIQRLVCDKTYADDCIVARVQASPVYIVGTNDRVSPANCTPPVTTVPQARALAAMSGGTGANFAVGAAIGRASPGFYCSGPPVHPRSRPYK